MTIDYFHKSRGIPWPAKNVASHFSKDSREPQIRAVFTAHILEMKTAE